MKTIILILFVLILAVSCFGQTSAGVFEKFNITNVGSIMIPAAMELQEGTYKELQKTVTKELLKNSGYEISGDSIVFQPDGLNEFKKLNTYARVMLSTNTGTKGEYQKLSAKKLLTAQQLKIFNTESRKELENSFKATGMKLIKWIGVSNAVVNGQSAIKTVYIRQLKENPQVYVEMFQFPNYDRMHQLTISYRTEDESIWKSALETTVNSFAITNIRK